MRTHRCGLIALLTLCLAAATSYAQIPQTIVIDGVNDFDLSNAIDADSADTEIKNWCPGDPEDEGPMDIGTVFVTNDASNLYIGFYYDKDCFGDANLGVAIDVGDTSGGANDPFGRKIGWANFADRPDFIVYDVVKTPTDNFEILYRWNGSEWRDTTVIANGVGSGNNALGIVEFASNFVEMKLPLCSMVPNLQPGTTQLKLEMWMTQEGAQKGPLDAVFSDDVQMSRATGTTFDTTDVVQMTQLFTYTVQTAADATGPTVTTACTGAFQLDPNKAFELTTDRVDILFDEAVDLATASNAGNYAINDPFNGFNFVADAQRDPVNCQLVHLTLGSPIGAASSFFDVTVTGVQDLAGNTIVNDGTTNVGSFFIQNVTFENDARVGLCKGIFAPSDTFSVEGNVAPLTFDPICDNALTTDGDSDSIWAATVPFCLPKDSGTGKGEATLEWKWVRNCSEFEPRAENRVLEISSDNGASVTETVFWNDDDPANFTFGPVDVVFQIDMSEVAPAPADTVALQGGQFPLSFDIGSGIEMVDDGSGQDAVAGDDIYTATVRFPECTAKSVGWKVTLNGVFECAEGQGNRSVFVNDAAFDTVGGANGPVVVPPRAWDACTVTQQPVTVVFRLKVDFFAPDDPQDTVAVRGDVLPLTFSGSPALETVLVDDGTGFDATAGDFTYTGAVTFPDSSNLSVQFKYWWTDGVQQLFECPGVDNRILVIDDVNFSTGTPQLRPVNIWDFCNDDVVSVPDGPGPRGGIQLQQNVPNPFGQATTIRFELARSAPVTLSIYDVAGRRVAELVDRTLPAGLHQVAWNRRTAGGARVPSGVYFYELRVEGQKSRRAMVVLE